MKCSGPSCLPSVDFLERHSRPRKKAENFDPVGSVGTSLPSAGRPYLIFYLEHGILTMICFFRSDTLNRLG